ncbi:N-acetylneuraminate synthase [Pseudooceanicola nitratireducens]|mgnify:CR=1 FL=1|jgi:N-acetylneuraminate synthase|uniref:N-acetylneuraminate synthase n=1 Tax=Pseudooceanicola nitratireducens TaxID=517719 RepID=A0A1I1QLB5_9RHOB|nr:N-acetylneuraminate synthase [Pseudooceanicola nitratireducens]SEJ73427.1 N-acetylneuraminate synthase [Pseudooceanicola nitratireducens]SFD18880.1 N-acetylneuraminate synthase [Pseudooceanicola nitratireducens]
MSTFVIAEAGVNHNGEDALAYQLVEEAAKAGADAIKFQTFSAAKVARPSAPKADYQTTTTGEGNQFDMLKKLEISPELHLGLMDRCRALGIEFMSTPFDPESADFLVQHGMGRLKIPSGEITNHVFLRHLAGLGVPMILSTGMATLDEVQEAVAVLRANWAGAEDFDKVLTILHCTSNYPAADHDVNLRAMNTIGAATGMPVGYSDHTLGIAVSPAAVALGAVVIEKHFTLDRGMEGPDHRASLEPGELAAMIAQIRSVEAALGRAEKAPTESEIQMRTVARRSIALARALPAGTVLSADHLVLLRPATGIAPRHFDSLLGRTLARDVADGDALTWDDIAGGHVAGGED